MINLYEVTETNKMIEESNSRCPDNHIGHQFIGLCGWRFE